MRLLPSVFPMHTHFDHSSLDIVRGPGAGDRGGSAAWRVRRLGAGRAAAVLGVTHQRGVGCVGRRAGA